MAQTPDYQKRNYPLPVYNFKVKVDDQTIMSFAEVSGIAMEFEEATYRHGLTFWEGEKITTFYYDSFMPVTLKRGIIWGEEGSSKVLFLYDWLKKKDLRPLEVSLCDENGDALISWKIAKAVPVKLEAPTFEVDSSGAAIESLELRARGVSLERHEPKPA